jgi:hypothetical protein
MFKDHFIQAYSANQAAPTITHGGYHGAANATDNYPNNNSLESIQASLGSLQMANNALVQATNDQLSNLTANTQQQFAQLAQQMAMWPLNDYCQQIPTVYNVHHTLKHKEVLCSLYSQTNHQSPIPVLTVTMAVASIPSPHWIRTKPVPVYKQI